MQALIKDNKRKLLQDKLTENIGKPKEFWKIIKKLGLPHKKAPTTSISFNTKKELTFSPGAIANTYKFEVSSVSILEILKEFKTHKATGVDDLAGRFLKDSSTTLCIAIARICNFSIKLASLPDKCKVAKIKPLYKKGLKSDPKNFRPISLLALISKIT